MPRVNKKAAGATSVPSGKPSTAHVPVGPPAGACARRTGLFIAWIGATLLLTWVGHASPRLLEPAYGGVLSYLYYQPALALAFLSGAVGVGTWASVSSCRGSPTATGPLVMTWCARLLLATAVVLAGSESAVRWVTQYRSLLGPWFGPHLTQLSHAYPLGFCAGAITALVTQGAMSSVATWPLVSTTGMAAVTWLMAGYLGCHLLPFFPTCPSIVTLGAAMATAGLGVGALTPMASANITSPTLLPSLSAAIGRALRRYGWVYVLVLGLLGYVWNREPNCQAGVDPLYHNRPELGLKVVDRAESLTGWVSVLDNTKDGNRILRSGHSVIGGRWHRPRESIFIIFYAMEGVQLIRNRRYDSPARGLQIGLGVGICTDSMQRLGTQMDVVEIDPKVYQFARQYFGLAKPHGVYLQDGRTFIEHSAANDTYDYVFHDVFTGGAVPPSLFSVEALTQIKRILKPHGVLALNFVGSLEPPLHRALLFVWKTLTAVFPHVVCYPEEGGRTSVITNMVFFASSQPIKGFRSPTRREINKTILRERVFKDLAANKMIDIEHEFKDYMFPELTPITDAHNPLAHEQVASAAVFWSMLNSLYPKDFWSFY
ncbi:hypothetical protein H4R34_003336 [Dimargaris verticillata]|uniref:S-adenosyl-L-methionine-dependent methyltransferase n=1 Tax=Dimargaris verticillata TaxID=2761393 RepID=A0A9W8E8C6_9FUNG|nr:hypothetical protein H4R34_003336 [Dimargaris verticillata]